MTLDDIGVVIIGRNEGARLIDCLRSVHLTAKHIVYVDSGSTDDSVETAERFGARVVALDASQRFTAARARNKGFAALRKLNPDIQLVQFIDGDCELDGGWLSTATDFIRQRNDIALVCGRRRERHPSKSVYNHLSDIEWDTPVGQAIACGGDSLVRVDAFESVDGFRPQLIAGEEPELCVRLREKGWRIWRLEAEMTRHDAAITRLSQWWVRAVRFGYAMAEVVQLHWRSPFVIWRRELARAIFWSAVLPMIVGLCALLHPVALLALLIYPLQICRIAIARGPASSKCWSYAFFLTLAKFAELQGILKFCWRRLNQQSSTLIEYK
jgi:GT2 family glycosyltransferase